MTSFDAAYRVVSASNVAIAVKEVLATAATGKSRFSRIFNGEEIPRYFRKPLSLKKGQAINIRVRRID